MKFPRLLLAFAGLIAFGIIPGQAQTAKLAALHSFKGDGHYPTAPLVQGSDGNFYGTTSSGGAHDRGTVFRITPAGVLTTLHVFSGVDSNHVNSDGASPIGGVIQGSDGDFYGTTYDGGANASGTVFKITSTGGFTTLYQFSASGSSSSGSSHGGGPNSPLVQGTDGNFYGITVSGGTSSSGTFFKITSTGTLTTLHNFNAGGPLPSGLILGLDGNFYGFNPFGGSNRTGAIIRLTPAGAVTTFFSFPEGIGDEPSSELAQDSDGAFYGTTYFGGSKNQGSVYKVTPDAVLTILHSFGTKTGDGSYPVSGVIRGRDGNFYGTTYQGQTIFQITPGGKLTPLADFNGANGASPYVPMVQGSDGNFYGVTTSGGAYNFGVVFELSQLDVLQFASPAYRVAEATGRIVLAVGRASFTTEAVTVRYATADGTATAGHDYTAASGTLSWAANDTAPKAVIVKLLNPGIEYGNGKRSFTVNLSAPTGDAAIGAVGAGTVALIGTTELPVITSATAASGDAGGPFSYQITGTHNPTRFGAQGLTPGLTVDPTTGLISGKLPPEGTYSLTLEAFNQGGEGTATLTLTTQLTAPVITSPATATGTSGTPFRYQITASGEPTRYGVDGLGDGLTVDSATGLISGTPTTVGKRTLTLHAFNRVGEGTQTVTVKISEPLPVITSPTTATATANQPFSFQITATNRPTQYHVLGMPPGLHVDADTGLISGTPGLGGAREMTIYVDNATGVTIGKLTLTVVN